MVDARLRCTDDCAIITQHDSGLSQQGVLHAWVTKLGESLKTDTQENQVIDSDTFS